jgi:hypothetical protein
MYDRDWYREERRQARRSAQQPAIQHQPVTLPADPPSLTSAKSILIILAVFAVALIVYGFA